MSNDITNRQVICIGAALVDSIIRGFDPEPISASGYRAESCSLNVGGEAVNEAIALASLGIDTRILCFLGKECAGKMIADTLHGQRVDTGYMSLWLPAYQIDAVDATGAGDNFVAGFASEILRGSSLSDALHFANACGAVCTTMVGAGTAIKSREQVLNFMKNMDDIPGE